MKRGFYLDLAASGMRMPIGTDLVLREQPDAETILVRGEALGRVVETAARRYRTPLAFPLMDLTVEKEALLSQMDVPAADIPTYHFATAPSSDDADRVTAGLCNTLTPRIAANCASIAYIAGQTDLVPVGMSIGPFSLMTKLIADPIAPVYMAGSGVTAEEDAEVGTVEAALDLGLRVILRSVEAQIEAGAKAIIICEPAANRVYLSPKQLDRGSDIFERYVMAPNRRLRERLAAHDVDLILHDCGELTDAMVSQIASLDPVILSLGSSRTLREDAARIPDRVVLYGNLPSKRFYSDDLVSVADVETQSCELIRHMRECGHPFILGSECDVLSVPAHHDTIVAKVDAFVGCRCD